MIDKKMISPSEIAGLAGVALPTVSNWMRRFEDFPSGVAAEGEKRQRYKLSEVMAWLEQRNLANTGTRERIELAALGQEAHRDLLGDLFVIFHHIADPAKRTQAEVLRVFQDISNSHNKDTLSGDFTGHPGVLGDLIERYKLLTDAALADVLIALEDSTPSRSRSESSTPAVLVEFLGALINGAPGAILDLASGQGRILEHFASRSIGDSYRGRDINHTSVIHARQVALLRNLDIRYQVGNGLAAVEPNSVSVAIADPPLGLNVSRDELAQYRWPYGMPSERDATTGFIQRAVESLATGGTGLVLSATGLLSRGGSYAEFRRELLMAGAVRGIVALPARLRLNTAVPMALWILGPPNPNQASVVMADASQAAASDLAADGPVVAALRAALIPDVMNQDETYAVSVPLKDLLTRDVALRPNSWVAKQRDLIEPQEQVALAHAAVEAFGAVLGNQEKLSMGIHVARVEPELVSLDELQERRFLKIVRAPFAKSADDGTGAPVLDARIVADFDNRHNARRLLDTNNPGLVIEPGDIVVASIAHGVIAAVWQNEGWVAGPAVQVIRVREKLLDPDFLVAAIEHPRNRAHIDAGAHRVQADIRSFEVPDIPLGEQRALATVLVQLKESETHLSAQLQTISLARRQISDAFASGTLLVTDHLDQSKP